MKSLFLNIYNRSSFEKIVIFFILLMGILLSASQFFYNRSLWLDEAMLSHSIINCGFFGLLHPLAYFQVAPISFLLIEKIFSWVIPNSEYGLRLFPMISYCASLFFFYKILKLIFKDDYTIIFALSLFVFNPTLIYYASEVKQYMTDVMVITLLYYLLLKNYKQPEYKYYFLGIAGIISISLSNVAPIILFTAGLYLFYETINKDKKYILKFAAVIFAWLVSFGVYYFLFIANHPAKGFMLNYWEGVNAFMPRSPFNVAFYQFLLLKYIMVVHSLLKFGIIGGICISIFISIGIVNTIIKKKTALLILIVTPVLVHLALSAFRLYPFDVRLILYLSPIIIILAGFGFDFLIKKAGIHIKDKKLRVFPFGITFLLFIIFIGKFPIRKEEIKKSLHFFNRNLASGEKLYLYYGAKPAFDYYKLASFYNIAIDPIEFGSWKDGISENDFEKFKFLTGRNWILFSHTKKVEENDLIKKLDSIGYNKCKEYKTYGSSIYLYDFSLKAPMIDTSALKKINNK